MKITPQTTLGELANHLRALGDPFITMMSNALNANARHVIAYMPGVGTFHGEGLDEAEALDVALNQLGDHHDHEDKETA